MSLAGKKDPRKHQHHLDELFFVLLQSKNRQSFMTSLVGLGDRLTYLYGFISLKGGL